MPTSVRLAHEEFLRRRYGETCPVDLDVWAAYEAAPNETVELLIRIPSRADVSPPQVAKFLVQGSEAPTARMLGEYMWVKLPFRQLFTQVLPTTSWRSLLPLMAGYSQQRIAQELRAGQAQEVTDSTMFGRDVTIGNRELRARWLLLMVDRLARTGGLERAEIIAEAAAQAEKFPVTVVASVVRNRPVLPAVFKSRTTVKADAAERVFEVDCSSITWAVIDTGIDASHASFSGPAGSRIAGAYDIPAARIALEIDEESRGGPPRPGLWLVSDVDWAEFEVAARESAVNRSDHFRAPDNSHGTHVAGILAAQASRPVGTIFEEFEEDEEREGDEAARIIDGLQGIAPSLVLVDINVYDRWGRSNEFDVMLGLGLVEYINRTPGVLGDRVIDGVNLSQTVPFLARRYACGWSPICRASDAVVRAGVVVVASAGNGGYDSVTKRFSGITITDPGNTESVLTVGATHRTEPHRFGPIAGSGRGPTADGRYKPDLLAPGFNVVGPLPRGSVGARSGTSQAAAHASGVAALILARYPELRGEPEMVKNILCQTATDLGRVREFQGHGLLDALRALQQP